MGIKKLYNYRIACDNNSCNHFIETDLESEELVIAMDEFSSQHKSWFFDRKRTNLFCSKICLGEHIFSCFVEAYPEDSIDFYEGALIGVNKCIKKKKEE